MAETNRICSVEGCGKQTRYRKYCNAHHARNRRHGDPLGGGAFYGEPMDHLNKTVLTYLGHECLVWPFARGRDGYGSVIVDGLSTKVHRFVCQVENGRPPSPEHQAAHNCGNGSGGCVARKHLSWKTPAQNQADRLIHGTSNRGERHGLAMLSEENVRMIRALKDKSSYRSIAKKFGVSYSTVGHIVRGETWGWLS